MAILNRRTARRTSSAIVIWAGLSAFTPFAHGAEDSDVARFPARPVRAIVPYAPGGGTDINNMIATLPQIKAGRLRVLAITTEKRSRALPQIPTIAESGMPGFDASGWFGVWSPANTPPAVINKLAAAFKGVLSHQDIAHDLERQGAEVSHLGPEDFAKFVRDEIERWRKVITTGRIVRN